MSASPFLFIVDDDDAVLDALQFVLQGAGYEPICFHSADEFWLFIQQQTIVLSGCVILDSRMPGMSGQELQLALKQVPNTLGIVFLTGHGDIAMAVDALKVGAVDFLQKPICRESLLKAVESALATSQNQTFLKSCIEKYQRLTKRERDMLTLLAQGKSNIEISQALHISPRTVEVHKANLLRHLDVTTLAQVVRIYTYLEPVLETIPPPPTRIRRKG